MKTVKELKAELDQFPDDAQCYAYEGEVVGIIVRNSNTLGPIGLIECPYFNSGDDPVYN